MKNWLKRRWQMLSVLLFFIVLFDKRAGVTLRQWKAEIEKTNLSRLENLWSRWHSPFSGEDALPESVLAALDLARTHQLQNFRAQGTLLDEQDQRITEGLWPIRFDEQSTNLFVYTKELKHLCANAQIIDNKKGVTLASCANTP